MDLETFWFVLIAVLWAGYFLLEGFDFGVGMLLPFVSRSDEERGLVLRTIGPVWDGNEVLAHRRCRRDVRGVPGLVRDDVLRLLHRAPPRPRLPHRPRLLVRVADEEREQGLAYDLELGEHGRSFGAALIWGVGLANLVSGVPIDSDGDFAGSFADLFSPYTLAAGVAVVLLFAFHGATFLTLRTTGELAARAERAARRLAIPAALVAAAFLVWTVAVAMDRNDKDLLPPALPAALGIAALALAVTFLLSGRNGRAFAMTGLGTIALVATLFTSLYPRVMVSSPGFENSLTVDGAASSRYALTVMSVVAVIFVPMVLLYQGWTYYVFRRRVGGESEAAG